MSDRSESAEPKQSNRQVLDQPRINLDELTAMLVTMCNVNPEVAVQITKEVSRIAEEAYKLSRDLTRVTVLMDNDAKQ